MSFSLYTIFQIISDFFGIFYISRFMNAFMHYDNKRNNDLYKLLYMAYPVLTVFSLLIGNIPIINIMVNIIALLIISFRYKCSFEKRIISVGLIFLMMLIIETVCALMGDTLNTSLISESPYKKITSIVLYNLTIYMVSVIFENVKISKKDIKLPVFIWICFISIPMLSIASVIITIQMNTLKTIHISALFIILLSINVMSFFIYDSIIETYEEKISNIALKEEKEHYRKQCIYMQETEKELSAFRHDIANQISLLKQMSIRDNGNKIDESVSYLEKKLSSVVIFSNTQNLVVDSILNIKYAEMKKYDISAELQCRVPCKLNIEPMDLMVIMGNILDNAIRAAKNVESEKFIHIKIVFENGMLYINIENSYSGKLLVDDGRFITTKSDSSSHGLGLQNIKRIVRKYHGTTKFNYTSEVFTSEIILYLR